MRSIKISFLLLALVGCAQVEPPIVNENPIYSKLEAQEIVLRDANDVARVADIYKRGGTKPVEIIVSYADGDAQDAHYIAQQAQQRLSARGVQSTINTIPASQNRVIALVTGLTAGADPSCSNIPGPKGSYVGYTYERYRLGCEIDAKMGQQVAHTRDLEGRAAGIGYDDASDAGRAGNTLNDYRAGKMNEPLKGIAASDSVDREK